MFSKDSQALTSGFVAHKTGLCCCLYTVCAVPLQPHLRIHVMNKYGIRKVSAVDIGPRANLPQPSLLETLFVGWCCMPCSTVQLAHEVGMDPCVCCW